MATRPGSRRAQHGLALLGLLAVIVMVFAYVITSRLNAASRFVGVDREHNSKVLAQAKRALIGYMAQQAALSGKNNPGHLPCPQAWGDFGTANEGRAAGNCSVPAAGWLPWRTLGLDRPLDASGNQIWYVISPGWHLPSAAATLSINSDSIGQLTLSGQPAVALLIAPGPALAIAPNADQVAADCAARNQSQVLALPGTPPDPLDFLECQNGSTADNVFAVSVVDNATNPVFNDQVLAITAADVMPALEAAIAERMQREIAPALRTVYTSSTYSGIPSGSPLFPYPVPFTNPGTSDYIGAQNLCAASPPNPSYPCQGLLPINPASSTVAYQSTPANAVETLGYGSIESGSQSCFWESSNDVRVCEGLYKEASQPWQPIQLEMTARFTNAAMGLRALDASRYQVYARDDSGSPPWTQIPASHEATMNSDGSVTVRFWATMPNIDDMGWDSSAQFRLRIERAVVGDHALVSANGRMLGFIAGSSQIRSGDTVTGASSGASGVAAVYKASGDWGTNDAAGTLFFPSVSGNFESGEPLQVAGSTKATASGTELDIGWLVRNQWHRVLYYAVARQNTALSLPSSFGCNTTNCLRFNEGLGCGGGADWCNIRALMVLAGASLSGASRPNGNLADYVEYANGDGGTFYEQHGIRRPTNVAVSNGPWNDRVILVDWLPPSLLLTSPNNHPQVVADTTISPVRVYYLPLP